MKVRGVRLALVAAVLAGAAAGLGGCAGLPATTEATAATDSRAAARAPRGPCAGPISEFETIIENDRAIGHLKANRGEQGLDALQGARHRVQTAAPRATAWNYPPTVLPWAR